VIDTLRSAALVGALLLGPAAALAQTPAGTSWPQEIQAAEGTIAVYQPQPEKLEGDTLSGRAAMSIDLEGRPESVFGVFWFDAKIATDSDAGSAQLRNVRVTNVRWPDSTEEGQLRFTLIVESALPAAGFRISLERLSASLADAEAARESLLELKSEPPVIVFRTELAVLLLYDGAPRFGVIDDTRYERALNTPFVVVRDKRNGECYLGGGAFWYRAMDPLGPWKPIAEPPKDLRELLPKPDPETPKPPSPPAIVVATEPTELVVTVGPPDFQSLPNGELLYVRNTETPWLRELATGDMYLLLSGRWFRARSQQGPWTFVRPDRLPASFKRIPPSSDIGGVRVSVAGTDEAEDAVLDAEIPQTGAIKRSEAKLEVRYDGAPRFEPIGGTRVSYAVNTGAQVLLIDGRYYACDNGVWFTATAATGPWGVADSIPDEDIQKIPPSSPVYNTTYVHVYESTPEVVYVGYTPGYMWSFPYYGVPVYGTGWHYPPYWGSVYYPRPPTWGFNVGYNPWTGWNVGLSWSNGFFTLGVGWSQGWQGGYPPYRCCAGWYGGGYRPPYAMHHGDINIGEINIGNSASAGNRAAIADRVASADPAAVEQARANVYNRTENRARNADAATAERNLQAARPAANRSNDVFADPAGNVARRSGDAWEVRQDGGWTRPSGTQPSSARATGTEPNRAAASDTPRSTTSPQATPQLPATSAGSRSPTASSQTPSHPATSQTQSRSVDQSSLNRSYDSRQHGAAREMRDAPMRAPMRPRGRR
jgi:hypothetical protein